jgi:hypothetical protein
VILQKRYVLRAIKAFTTPRVAVQSLSGTSLEFILSRIAKPWRKILRKYLVNRQYLMKIPCSRTKHTLGYQDRHEQTSVTLRTKGQSWGKISTELSSAPSILYYWAPCLDFTPIFRSSHAWNFPNYIWISSIHRSWAWILDCPAFWRFLWSVIHPLFYSLLVLSNDISEVLSFHSSPPMTFKIDP